MKDSYVLPILLGVLFYLHITSAEVFTALAEMEELLDTEAVLVANLEAYISAHEEKLEFLKRCVYNNDNISNCINLKFCLSTISRVKIYQREHNEAASDIAGYLSNPINAYLLTKRLTSDWKSIEEVMSFDVGAGK